MTTWPLNLYAYVGNNPVNANDPSGNELVVLQEGTNIDVNLTVVYSGPGVTPTVQQRFDQGIEQAWSGNFDQYSVSTTVTSVIANSTSKLPTGDYSNYHYVEVPTGDATAFVRGIGGLTGVWPGNSPDVVAAHEAGHFFGNNDRYTSVYDASGNRTSTFPQPGWEGNLMAQIPGTVEGRNITEMLGFNAGSIINPSGFSDSAAGGFVLYPNKANSNMMRSVYEK